MEGEKVEVLSEDTGYSFRRWAESLLGFIGNPDLLSLGESFSGHNDLFGLIHVIDGGLFS